MISRILQNSQAYLRYTVTFQLTTIIIICKIQVNSPLGTKDDSQISIWIRCSTQKCRINLSILQCIVFSLKHKTINHFISFFSYTKSFINNPQSIIQFSFSVTSRQLSPSAKPLLCIQLLSAVRNAVFNSVCIFFRLLSPSARTQSYASTPFGSQNHNDLFWTEFSKGKTTFDFIGWVSF